MHLSSGDLWHSSGNLWQVRAQLRGAPPSWILGRNGFLWSSQVKLHVLGAFGAVRQFRRNLPEVAGGGYAICVDRITACVLVFFHMI